MTTQEINIGNALATATEVISKMIAQGIGDAKSVYAVSNFISSKFDLTQDESIIVIDQAIKLA